MSKLGRLLGLNEDDGEANFGSWVLPGHEESVEMSPPLQWHAGELYEASPKPSTVEGRELTVPTNRWYDGASVEEYEEQQP
jgi:hypothetical protein